MIISKRHQLIVLHCRKAAGSSLCVSLARLLGPEDLQISALAETMALGIPLSQRVRRIAWRQSRGLLPLFRLLGPRVYRRALTRAVDHAYRPLLGRKPPHAPAACVAATSRRSGPAFASWRSFATPGTKRCLTTTGAFSVKGLLPVLPPMWRPWPLAMTSAASCPSPSTTTGRCTPLTIMWWLIGWCALSSSVAPLRVV